MFLEKIIKYLLGFSLILPVVFLSNVMYPWNFGKILFFQVFVDILALLAGVYFLVSKKTFKRFTFLDYVVLAFFASLILSAFFGFDFSQSFFGDQGRASGVFTWLHFGVFYFLLRQFFDAKKDWFLTGSFAVFIGVASSVLAWLGKYFPDYLSVATFGDRLSGLIGNPIFFASYIIFPLFLAFYFFINTPNEAKIKKWLYFSAGVFLLISLVASEVRGAFVGLLASIFIIWIFLGFSDLFSKKIRTYILIAGTLFFIAFFGFYALNQKIHFTEARIFKITTEETTAKTRLMAWNIAFKAWQERPIFGYGPENYRQAFDKNYNPEFLKYSFSETIWDKPHNYFLEVLSEDGAVGAIAYLAVLVSIFYFLFFAFKKSENRDEKLGIILLFGAFTAYIVQNLFAFETSNSMQLWFFMLAFLAFLYEVKNKKENIAQDALLKTALVVLIAFSFFSLFENYIFFRSSYYMSAARDYFEIGSIYKWGENAQKTLAVNAPFEAENAVFLTRDLKEFDKANQLNADQLRKVAFDIESTFLKKIKEVPNSYFYNIWLGQLYGVMGEYLDGKYFINAENAFKKAGDTSKERQQVPIFLSQNYMFQGKYDLATSTLDALVSQHPEFAESHWFLGLSYMQAGNDKKGIEELEKGISFGLGSEKNILFLAGAYIKLQEYKKVIPLYQELINRHPNNASYYHDEAVMHMASGDKEKSLEYFKKALSLEPGLKKQVEDFLKQFKIDINSLNN